jgi:Fe-S-cluster-containing hydrogenase component 2
MIGCPTGAIHRELEGQVVINDNICIGCSTCANSCPYENIKMVQARNAEGEFSQDAMSLRQVVKASKCDLCVDQLDGPACQRACPHDALKRIDLFELSTLIKEVE